MKKFLIRLLEFIIIFTCAFFIGRNSVNYIKNFEISTNTTETSNNKNVIKTPKVADNKTNNFDSYNESIQNLNSNIDTNNLTTIEL